MKKEGISLKLKKILCVTGVVFSLSLLFIAGVVIKGYRNFKREIETQLFSERFLIEEIGLTEPLSQSVIAEGEIPRKPPLNLRLLGTILGEPAIAHIEDLASKKEGSYKVGDIISGAKIVEIQLGKVILERDGQRELLVFVYGGKERAITEISPTERIVSKKGVLKEIGYDINKTLTMAKVTPRFNFMSRKFSGFKIDDIQKGSIAERAGLENGDVVEIVNGQKLSSPQKAIQIFRKVRKQSRVDLDLLRKNRLVRLKYKIID